MKKLRLVMCVAAALGVAAVSPANADATDGKGTVTFNGKLINQSCVLEDNSVDITVTLPTMSTKSLDKPGAIAGSKLFNINVKDCPSAITKVAAYFEAMGTSGVNSSTNNLKNSATNDPATNVEVRLYDADETHLPLGNAGKLQNVNATTKTASMTYYGGYYATGQTTAGNVYAQAKFTLSYE
ncbi:fimbrial protein [Pantoea sp.]|uniref:fimbrial protein n=1 Tax=Pantoea sp. TaxID=69393 RepID=UPI00289A1DDA|nr:fimbrial protein [Pantoea sp.]